MSVKELLSRRAGYLGNVTKQINLIRGYLVGPSDGYIEACEDYVRKLLEAKSKFDEVHDVVVNDNWIDRKTISACEDGATRATHSVVAVLDDFEHWTQHGPSVTPHDNSASSGTVHHGVGQDVHSATLDMLDRLHHTMSAMKSETTNQAVQYALSEQQRVHDQQTMALNHKIEELSRELGRLSLLQKAQDLTAVPSVETVYGDTDYRRHPSGVMSEPGRVSVLHSTGRDSLPPARPSFGRGRARGRARPSSILPLPEPNVGRASDRADLKWDFTEAASAMRALMSQSVLQNSSLVASLQAPKVALKKFTGSPLEYMSFVTSFDELVHEAYDSDRSRLLVLMEHCTDRARVAIESCLHMPSGDGYRAARATLERKFGSPHVITQAWLDKLLGYPAVVEGSTLEMFATDVEACRNGLRALGSLSELECVGTLQRIIMKLPLHLRNRWRKLARASREDGTSRADLLVQMLRDAAEDDNDPAFCESVISRVKDTYGGSVTPRVTRVQSGAKKGGVFAACNSEDDDDVEAELHAMNKGSCAACRSGQHFTSRCRNYRELTPAGKLEFVKSKKLCLLCLSDSHMVVNCPLPWRCQDKACGRRHHTSLHASFEGVKPRGPTPAGPPPPTSCNLLEDGKDGDFTTYETEDGAAYAVMCTGNLPIAKVTVRYGERSFNTYALLDSGATLTLCRRNVMESLGVPVVGKKRMSISTISGNTFVNSDVVEMHVSECSNRIAFPLHQAMVVDNIHVSMRGLAKQEEISRFPHLRDLRFNRGDEDHVGLLIGQNNAHLIDPMEVVRGGYYDPYAVGTPLGWVVYGNLKEDFSRGDKPMPRPTGKPPVWQPARMVNTLEEQVENGEIHTIDMLCLDEFDNLEPEVLNCEVDCKEDVVPELASDDACEFLGCTCGDADLMKVLEKLASLDHVPDADSLSADERYVLELWEREMRIVDGHVEIPIPFKQEPPELINNFVAAYRALIHLGNQLLKDKARLKQYREAVLAYFQKGYAEVVLDAHPSLTEFVWYMLHHGVDHPRKPGVTRVVKHGGARYKGYCLNEAAYQGPNMMNNLSEVLTRFRQFKVGSTADIEGMFNQVFVPERQRDYSRFLFWEDGDPTKKVIVCRMKTHIFGTVWAPAAANFALRKMADLHIGMEPEIRESIKQDFYVDDWLSSRSTCEEASMHYCKVREAVAEGGFNMIKLMSNSRKVISDTPKELRAKELAKIDLARDKLPSGVLLGQPWFPESDEFGFKIAMEPRPFTRRGMTSCIASVFDPLGLISPFILPAKLLLQSSSKSGTGWDDELINSTSQQWSAWLQQLPEIENFRLRRWFGCEPGSQQYIHMFSDACERSYGAASYLAVKRGKENVATLISSKSRVSPPNKLTVPKMEMAAAVLAVKLMQIVKRMFSVFITAIYYWVDSTIVLILIRKDPDTLRTFMSNRVAYIRSESLVSQWGHVPGRINPADLASRGESIGALSESSLWLSGPEFLKENPESWEKRKLQVLQPLDVSAETKREKPVVCGMICAVSQQDITATEAECLTIKAELLPENIFRDPESAQRDTLNAILLRYSSWTKVVRLAVIVTKYIGWLKIKAATGKRVMVNMTVTVKELRREEINLISWEQSLCLDKATTQELAWKQLLPFWDGIWRVGGRGQFSELSTDVKHPIILPRTSTVTRLLVGEAHRACCHGGTDRTLMELRGRYWIMGGKPTLKKYVDPCLICKRLRGAPMNQQMAPLPRERIATSQPAFTHSGVDLFGPMYVIVKRSKVKRYGAIFTCFNSRAIHLEPVDDLTASTFLDTIERFCMRRVKPMTLRSDNGTNFIRSEKEIARASELLADESLQRSLTTRRIEWSFNTPSASHQGGVWERLIRSVRQIITVMISDNPVTDSRFHTILCVAEGIMNSRPLTRLTEDVRDLEPLTPGHFTCGGRITSMMQDKVTADTLRQDWRLSRELGDRFWDQWLAQYFPLLQKRTKWLEERENISTGELVLIVNDQCARFDWPLGRVVEVHAGRDGLVRNVTLKTGSGVLKRPIQKIVRLEMDCA